MSARITLKSLRWSSILIIFAAFIILAVSYPGLPDQVPIHYNHRGEIDNYGPRSSLWIVPVLAALMCYVMIRSTHWISRLNPNLKKKEVFIIGWSSHLLSFLIALSFTYVTLQTVFIAKEGSGNLGIWFLPVFGIGMIVIPMLPLFWTNRKV